MIFFFLIFSAVKPVETVLPALICECYCTLNWRGPCPGRRGWRPRRTWQRTGRRAAGSVESAHPIWNSYFMFHIFCPNFIDLTIRESNKTYRIHLLVCTCYFSDTRFYTRSTRSNLRSGILCWILSICPLLIKFIKAFIFLLLELKFLFASHI